LTDLPPRRDRVKPHIPEIIRADSVLGDDDPFGDSAAAPEPEPQRREMRTDMREEDPRVRAARRAAEIMGNINDLDEGEDEFYIDQKDVPDGWTYEWKRLTLLNKEDPSYTTQLERKGWEPVPAKRHPSYMPTNSSDAIIERKGMILMERPKEITDEVKRIEMRKARNQIRQKQEQLNSAPDGTFTRNGPDGRPLTKLITSYEAMPVPE
jgi:hypothetical protein